ncbi:MbnP family copper-binding protein [Teredinibacter turnerae]|uniref:MbnP family copper-binding protein n=1 Tax=Teredinibacter turnerae TaxID=2426 RepID=UPI0004778F89
MVFKQVKSCKSAILLAVGIALNGCAPQEQATQLRFELQVPSGARIDMGFYLSSIELRGSDGQWRPLHLPVKQPVALIHLTDQATQQVVSGQLSAGGGDYRGLRFTVGVPEALNHANPLTAAFPLNDSGMFWSWQQGYKFLRIDATGSNKWALHVGSTGCQSPSAIRPPASPCTQSNRVTITLPDYNPASDQIAVDIRALAALVDKHASSSLEPMNSPERISSPEPMNSPERISSPEPMNSPEPIDSTEPTNSPEPVDCSMHYAMQPVCRAMFDTIGLNADTGECHTDCTSQQLFHRIH